MAKWQPDNTGPGENARDGKNSYGDVQKPGRDRPDMQGGSVINPIDVPMAGNARESLRNAVHDSSTPERYGIRGKEGNFGISEPDCVGEAERYDRDGYDCDGLRIVTGRSAATKFTGRK